MAMMILLPYAEGLELGLVESLTLGLADGLELGELTGSL
jgi:hypothetical protein